MAASFVQASSADSTTVTFSAAGAGNLLVCFAIYGTSGAIGAVTPGWTALTAVNNATQSCRMFYKIAAGGETSFQVDGGALCMVEYSGITAVPLDVENAQATGSGTTHTTPTVTPTAGLDELVVFATGVKTTATWSTQQVNGSSTGVAERVDFQTASHGAAQISDLEVASTTGTYAGSAVSSGAAAGTAAIALFKVAAVTPPGSPPAMSPPLIGGRGATW